MKVVEDYNRHRRSPIPSGGLEVKLRLIYKYITFKGSGEIFLDKRADQRRSFYLRF